MTMEEEFSTRELKTICEMETDQACESLDRYKSKNYRLSLRFLKDLLKRGKTKIFRKLVDIGVSTLPITKSARLNLLEFVKPTEEDMMIFIPMIDNSTAIMESIVIYMMKRRETFRILLTLLPNIADESKLTEYADIIFSRLSSDNDERTKEFLIEEPIMTLLRNIIGVRLLLIQWEHGYLDVVLNNIHLRQRELLSNIVFISCKRKSLGELERIYSRFGKTTVPPVGIIFLIKAGEVDIIDYIETFLDPSCEIIDSIRRIAISDDVSSKVIVAYAKWFIRRGLLRIAANHVIHQLIKILISYDETSILDELLRQLVDVSENFKQAFDYIFTHSPIESLKKLVRDRVITTYNLRMFIDGHYLDTNRLSAILEAQEEEGETEELKGFVLSLLTNSSLNDNFCIGVMRKYPQWTKEYGAYLFSIYSRCSRSAVILYLITNNMVDISASLLYPLFRSSSLSVLREIYHLCSSEKSSNNLNDSLNSLCHTFIRNKDCHNEFSLLIQTQYISSIDFTKEEVDTLIPIEYIIDLLGSVNFVGLRMKKKNLINNLFHRICKEQLKDYQLLCMLMRGYADILDQQSGETYLALECMFSRRERVDRIFNHLRTIAPSFDFTRSLLILFIQKCIKKIDDLKSRYDLDVQCGGENVLQIGNQIFLLPVQSKQLIMMDRRFRINRLRQNPIQCFSCHDYVDRPYVHNNGKHNEYYCYNEFLKSLGSEPLVRKSCPICLDEDAAVYKIEDCGHVFCITCLTMLFINPPQHSSYLCPLCRKPILCQDLYVNPYGIY